MANRSLLLPISLLFACSGEKDRSKEGADATPSAAKRPSLVIATLDTTRADRIGAYGYAGAQTPTLDGLASGGARFEVSYATVPLTTPSHSSMFTGTYPTRHGVRNNGDAILSDDATTLAELLQKAGWKTGASVSAFVTTRVWNLDQGFDAYSDQIHSSSVPQNRWGQERPANEVVDDALSWLAGVASDEPFFLWVHFYDAHHPYRPPSPFNELLPGRPYDGEIAFMDSEMGRLKSAIDARNQKDGVAWIAVGDHGEALNGEHGEFTHGTFLFDPTMRIPFIVRPADPLAAPVAVRDATVSNVDVMPTALGLLGQPIPADLDGVDLSGASRGGKVERGGVYMESQSVAQRFGYHPEIAVAEGPLKLMDTPNPRLFDIQADPNEENNLAASRPDDVARLKKITEAVNARSVKHEGGAAMSPEVLEQLAALGYVNAGGDLSGEGSTIDAKDKLETIRGLDKARVLGRAPDGAEEAVALYKEILAKEPQIVEARLGLAQLLQRMQRLPEAEQVLRDALAQSGSSTVLHQNLAIVLARQTRFDEALREAEAVLVLVPGDESALQLKVRILGQLGRDQEAFTAALAAYEKNPASGGLQAMLGLAYARQGDPEKAGPLLQKSLEDGVPRPGVHEVLGRMAASVGDTERAIVHLRTEADIFGASPRARRMLGGLYMRAKRWDDAANEYRSLCETGPENPMLRRAWAQAVFNTGDYTLARDVLEPALKAAPENAHIIMLQANIEAKIGDPTKGAELAQRARELYAVSQGDMPPEQGDLEGLMDPSQLPRGY